MSERSQADVANDFDDFKVLGNLKKLNRDELFDEQFLDFMRWFKKDVHSRYKKSDFQKIERNDFLFLVFGYIALIGCYISFRANLPEHPFLWGIPLFIASIVVIKKASVVHMRTHAPQNLTGNKVFDRAIDILGLASCGISTNVLKRRHLAAHYNDVGNVSRLFSTAWITFDELPMSYYVKPYLLIKFLLDKEFCENEKIDRRLLLIETILFYGFMAAIIYETFFLHSYFLLAFHVLPGLLVSSSQAMGASFAHSGVDKRNSFESNGLFDPKKLTGLLKVSNAYFAFFNDNFTINHGIHHAYPRVPLEIINKEYEHYHQHIFATYKDVRFNQLNSQKMHKNILERLPTPNFLNVIVTLFICVVAHVSICLTILGFFIAPIPFEPFLVDYRIFTKSTPVERMTNFIKFMDNVELHEKFQQTKEPNTYLNFVHARYQRFKARLATAVATATQP
jgi:hypothetical protein